MNNNNNSLLLNYGNVYMKNENVWSLIQINNTIKDCNINA